MLPTIFKEAIPLLTKIESAGFEAYFVGGSVRDFLLERPINDVDIATSAFPEEIKGIFPQTADIGIDHGTVLVIEETGEYEITTFRTESGYEDFRRPDSVEFIRSLEDDLRRRDFTMNSLAMDADGHIYDPFNGQDDIEHKMIKTVGEASERFSEDALRMLRGIRFVSQLGFKLESATLEALKTHSSLLTHIAVERKTMEFEKMIAGGFRREALRLLLETSLYIQLPGLSPYKEAIRTMADLPGIDRLTTEQTWLLLLSYIDESPSDFLKEWKLPSKTIKERTKEKHILTKRMKEGWSKGLLYDTGLERAINVEKVYECIHSPSASIIDQLQEEYNEFPIKSLKEVKVTGSDLMEWTGKNGGPWIKETLQHVEQAIINGEIQNDTETIRRWLEECNRLEKN
ncbi:CCA tRNA nucleotidyltransferase [Rossellomorea aquimaris]|uniref:CCA tRNA nucleotidyltransferase n=1 Tax=Rossellomorea aquimaris TaxID=189382 RepID=UPI001CD378DE|nr:CCA tRNA nucleotidyltransferase [Rossellomorea aquimaris]MCA1054616.1 CCA tRNA nucleotidyltransferase [Rossellomorea aquimaris]